MEQRQCVCCRTRFTPIRNPNQRHCSKLACQKKRHSRYKRQKLRDDSDYKQNKHAAQRRWCKKHPDYWKKYRARKPMYVESNRIAQRIRNMNRSYHKASEPLTEAIAKIPPLVQKNNDLSMNYQLILLAFDVIAKRAPYRQEDGVLLA